MVNQPCQRRNKRWWSGWIVSPSFEYLNVHIYMRNMNYCINSKNNNFNDKFTDVNLNFDYFVIKRFLFFLTKMFSFVSFLSLFSRSMLFWITSSQIRTSYNSTRHKSTVLEDDPDALTLLSVVSIGNIVVTYVFSIWKRIDLPNGMWHVVNVLEIFKMWNTEYWIKCIEYRVYLHFICSFSNIVSKCSVFSFQIERIRIDFIFPSVC